MRNAFVGFWMVVGLAGLIVLGANVAVSLHRISTECDASPAVLHAHGAGGLAWAK